MYLEVQRDMQSLKALIQLLHGRMIHVGGQRRQQRCDIRVGKRRGSDGFGRQHTPPRFDEPGCGGSVCKLTQRALRIVQEPVQALHQTVEAAVAQFWVRVVDALLQVCDPRRQQLFLGHRAL
eukprot:3934159-Rhodomonas_salina.4